MYIYTFFCLCQARDEQNKLVQDMYKRDLQHTHKKDLLRVEIYLSTILLMSSTRSIRSIPTFPSCKVFLFENASLSIVVHCRETLLHLLFQDLWVGAMHVIP